MELRLEILVTAKIRGWDRTLNNPLLLREEDGANFFPFNQGGRWYPIQPVRHFSLYKFNYRSSVPILHPLRSSSSSTFNIDIASRHRSFRLEKKRSSLFPSSLHWFSWVWIVRCLKWLAQINWHARQLESVVTIFKINVSKRVDAFVKERERERG